MVVLAQDAARCRGNTEVDLPHLLIGLLCEEEGIAAKVLFNAGTTVQQIVEVAGLTMSDEETKGSIPFTDDARKALELALREALALGQNYIATEAILLGVNRVDPELVEEFVIDARTKVLNRIGARTAASIVTPKNPALDAVAIETTTPVALTPGEISSLISVLSDQPMKLRTLASAYDKLEAALCR